MNSVKVNKRDFSQAKIYLDFYLFQLRFTQIRSSTVKFLRLSSTVDPKMSFEAEKGA